MNLSFLPALLALAAVAAVAGVGAGCSLKKAAPDKHTFVVEARRAGNTGALPPGANPGPALRIRGWQVAPAFDSRGFVYRQGPLRYTSDFYNEFLAPPRTLFTEQARRWLAASAAFTVVTDATSQADTTLSLEGTVTELYGDYRDPRAPKAVLAVQIVVLRSRPTPTAVWQREYRRELPLSAAAPAALVEGWSRALAEILQALEADLLPLRDR